MIYLSQDKAFGQETRNEEIPSEKIGLILLEASLKKHTESQLIIGFLIKFWLLHSFFCLLCMYVSNIYAYQTFTTPFVST